MGTTATNLRRITNLSELSSQYRLYRIKGLDAASEDYYRNQQIIIKKLSYSLQKPVLVIVKDKLPYLVVRADAAEPPSPMRLVRQEAVVFEPREPIFELDYTRRSSANDEICLRFLRFAIQGEISKNRGLWQTSSGAPFYWKTPESNSRGRELFAGFIVRPAILHDGGIGLCVDITHRVLSKNPLPSNISPDDFQKQWQGQHCVYKYGKNWFEITVHSLSDFTVETHPVPLDDGSTVALLDFINKNADRPFSPELTNLSPTTSVVRYRNNQGDMRSAPTTLCYPIYGTDDESTGTQHERTILEPYTRYRKINEVIEQYLQNLRIGGVKLETEKQPITFTTRTFPVPDLEFGNNVILSATGSPDAEFTELNELGKKRLHLLEDKKAGFYIQRDLDNQYLILPQSVRVSYGEEFITALQNAVARLYPGGNYKPIVRQYDDRGKHTLVAQARAIRELIEEMHWDPGYAVVMVHNTPDKRIREQDELEALVMDEFEKIDIRTAVIHSEVPNASYEHRIDESRGSEYVVKSTKFGRFSGYLRNVAINKVLLTNSRWPFILSTPLNADITIGIDVKNNTAGLVLVDKYGHVRERHFKTRLAEKISADRLSKNLVQLIKDECRDSHSVIRHIVIHRDGRIFDTEIQGIRSALAELKQPTQVGLTGISPQTAVTLLTIAKTSFTRIRLFDASYRSQGRLWINGNPLIGDYYVMNSTDAYICTTGRPFNHQGTVNPLNVQYVEGDLEFEKCLEDVFSLSNLAWTRPDDVSRYPITIKLNDRFLRDTASEYDEDKYEDAVISESADYDE